MKKQIIYLLPCLMAAVISSGAYADITLSTNRDGTNISIVDVTEEKISQYPVEIQTMEENGISLLMKTFLVPKETDPQSLVEEKLSWHGREYRVSDILCRELEGETQRKTVSRNITLTSKSDQEETLLSLLEPSLEYEEGGYTGTLLLDRDSIRTEASGTSRYSYTLNDTREYMGLTRNDPYYIPKTVEKNGFTLNLENVDWTPMASGGDNSETPTLFQATAVYSGTAWGNRTDEYLVTAAYTGEVTRTIQGDVAYSIVYEEIPMVDVSTFPWQTVLFVGAGILLAAGTGTAVFWLRKSRAGKKANSAIYAERPKMEMPELLGEMDRGEERI